MQTRHGTTGLVVGIDLGGTHMQIGAVDAHNTIISRTRGETVAREGMEKVIHRIVDAVRTVCNEAGTPSNDLAAVGIAAPGAIDIPAGVILDAPNLQWNDVPLRAIMEEKLGCRVILDNDVNAAIWGEYRLGAARDCPNTLGVWVGTGVGGGLVIDGKLYHGDFHTAGEIGQTILIPDGEVGRRTVEDFCSRTGMARTIRHTRRGNQDADTGIGQEFSSDELAAGYRNHDQAIHKTVCKAANYLGIAVANWVTVLSLQNVVIGGGVAEVLGREYLDQIRASFMKHVFPDRCRECRIEITKLREDAGLLGAAMLAREHAQTEQ